MLREYLTISLYERGIELQEKICWREIIPSMAFAMAVKASIQNLC